ncbi:MAG: inorganic triphosphatase [Enterobacteriaceae bacterium]|jgi:triphosphatase|nr:inorganic triphosphatase [Enterobacteriaceae bacterium]
MTVEIELKFIATPAAVAALPAQLAHWKAESHNELHLSNTYYDTADGLLRSQRFGLRIRSCNNAYEMTFKSGGNVVGGIAHRAEYNIDLPANQLDISLLPADIWGRSINISQLQQELSPLFSTNFKRETWLINFQQSQIEVALDLGTIQAGAQSEPISELEMELKQGNAADMLALAQQLTTVEGLRLGSLSKAARGYRLLNGNQPLPPVKMNVLQVAEKASTEQGLTAMLEWAFAYWQHHETHWFDGEKSAQYGVRHALTVIREILVIYGGIIPRKASTSLRERLVALEQLLETKQDAAVICYPPSYLQLKLDLMAWLMNKGWQPFIDQKGQQKLAGSFKRFADVMLSRSRSELKEAFNKPLSNDGFNDQQPRLERQIINLYLLSGAYDKERVLPYIDGWQKLFDAQGDRDLLRRQALEQPLFWLNSAQHV